MGPKNYHRNMIVALTGVTVTDTHTTGCCRGPAEPVLGGGGVPVRARAEAPHDAVVLVEVGGDSPHLKGGGVGGILLGRFPLGGL